VSAELPNERSGQSEVDTIGRQAYGLGKDKVGIGNFFNGHSENWILDSGLRLSEWCRPRSKGVLSEAVHKAETEVFGPPEVAYQAQFLSGVSKKPSHARSADPVAPNQLLAFGNRSRKFRVQLRKTRLGKLLHTVAYQ
jgi:hypothetical protein